MFEKKKKVKEEKTKDKKEESAVVTKESVSATCAVFSLLAFIILCTKTLIFGEVGRTVHIFLLGAFGYLAYPVVLGVFYLSVTGLFGARFVKNRKVGWCVALALLFVALSAHVLVTYSWEVEGYLKACFLSGEAFPATAPTGFFGGAIVLGVSSLFSAIGAAIAFGALGVFFLYLCYAQFAKKKEKVEEISESEAEEEPQPAPEGRAVAPQPVYADEQVYAPPTYAQAAQEAAPTYSQPTYSSNNTHFAVPETTQRPGVSLNENEQKAQPNRGFSPFATPQDDYGGERMDRETLFGGSPAENFQKNLLFDPTAKVNQRKGIDVQAQPVLQSDYTPSYTKAFEKEVNERVEPVRPAKVVNDYSKAYLDEPPYAPPTPPAPPVWEAEAKPVAWETEEKREPIIEAPLERAVETDYAERTETPVERTEKAEDTPYRRHEYMDLFSVDNPNVFGNDEGNARFGRDFADRALERGREELSAPVEEPRKDGFSLLDDEDDDPYTLRSTFEEPNLRGRGETFEGTGGRGFDETSRFEETRGRGFDETPLAPAKPAEPPKPVEPPKPRVIKPYIRPRLDDFDCRDIEPTANEYEVQQTKEDILATLEEFKITGATISSVTFGPTVTRYNVTIPRSISPKKVVALDQSIAINLHSNGVNIYPNYEDGVVSIEVPNAERQFVQLGCMLSGDTFVNAKPSSLTFAMGKDVANRKVYGDISKMIHLLVAGSSGSGKSVFLGSLIISLIYKYSPEELRLILIDPKKTEFVLYNNLPHLMINEIITDAGKAVQSLNWAIGEMNRRYTLFEKMSRSGKYVVNLDQYNEQLEKAERLPKIVIIIDELADLMLAAKKEMEDRIQNLTQKARAAGIHLIVATQRPSTDVITGVIKSNLATRVAFYVATDVDSRVILDQTGAQKLLGKGDFLYTMPGINVPVRVQSAFISSEDSQRIVSFIKNNNEAYYDEEATAFINSRGGNGGDADDSGNGDGGVDPMYIEALKYVIQSNSASISMIQRKCSAGYNRAGKIIEWMEDMGYISPFDGAKARKVRITKEEFESKYGSF